MGSIYLTWLADEFRAAGATVKEYDNQWKTRSRSSGGFAATPLGVSWHHTAGATGASAQSECDYMVKSSDARPTCNIYIARDGVIWVLAAGATNTSGSGGPLHLSRGQVPKDCANTTTVGMEIGNNGVGEPYPQAQVDAAFLASNVINRQLGNHPSDLFSHNLYAPSRKIDPARNTVVQGPWQPRSTTSSGTWNTDDIRAEAVARAGGSQPPTPPEEDEMQMASVYLGGGRVDTFVIGKDGHLYHNWLEPSNGAWYGWQDLGGQGMKGVVSACGEGVNGSPQRLDVFVQGTDEAQWHVWYPETIDENGIAAWSGWERVMEMP
jgi:hypothetical protein